MGHTACITTFPVQFPHSQKKKKIPSGFSDVIFFSANIFFQPHSFFFPIFPAISFRSSVRTPPLMRTCKSRPLMRLLSWKAWAFLFYFIYSSRPLSFPIACWPIQDVPFKKRQFFDYLFRSLLLSLFVSFSRPLRIYTVPTMECVVASAFGCHWRQTLNHSLDLINL